MTDDRFDDDLRRRLAAYEGRVPADISAAQPDARRSRGLGWPIVIGGGLAAVAAVVLAVVLLTDAVPPDVGQGSPTPSPGVSPSAVPSGSTSPSSPPESESAEPSSAPTAPTTELSWTTTAAFTSQELADGGGQAIVWDVTDSDAGLVAVGVQFHEALPNVGPLPPHDGRIWLSPDGRSWEDVTPTDQFANVNLQHVFVRTDGQLVAIGGRTGGATDGAETAWFSTDGRTWTSGPSGLPSGAVPFDVVNGARGFLAQVHPGQTSGPQLWYSADGAAWENVRELGEARASVGAGDEGFVVADGMEAEGSDAFVIASSDGRAWFESASPPPGFTHVAPLGADWIAVTAFADDVVDGRTWHSANGLDWAEHGRVPLIEVEADGLTCPEAPAELTAAGPWLILNVQVSYPCSEGGYQVHGTQQISIDGASWTPLPFETGTPGEFSSGAAIHGAVQVPGGLVVVGEEDGRATFWFGEPS